MRDMPAHRFFRDTLHRGKPSREECVTLGGQVFAVRRQPFTIVSLEDEWYEDVADPETVIHALRHSVDFHPDIFTFWQRVPDTERRYPYFVEWERLAVLPITSYDNWLHKVLRPRVRSQLRKSEKDGLTVRETAFDDDFVRGMTKIFNESPVRQGRAFWHYGKDFDTVKTQFSRFIHRERMIGAYFGGELVGFIMLGHAGSYGVTGQIISSIKHRDKAPNNALIAKAVDVCERMGLRYLVYLHWTDDTLGEFKRRCGFEPVAVPRYYVPLTWRGWLALKLGLHRGLREWLPPSLKAPFKRIRTRLNALRSH